MRHHQEAFHPPDVHSRITQFRPRLSRLQMPQQRPGHEPDQVSPAKNNPYIHHQRQQNAITRRLQPLQSTQQNSSRFHSRDPARRHHDRHEMHRLIHYECHAAFRQRGAPRQSYFDPVNRQVYQRQSHHQRRESQRIRHRRHEKSRQHRCAREINRPVFQIPHRAPALLLLHQRTRLKNKIRQQMPQQKRQYRSHHVFHLIPPLARLCTTFHSCTFSYNLSPSLLYQRFHPLHRLFHLPEISSLQIPRHCRNIQPHRLGSRLQPAPLPEHCNRFPLLLRNLHQQRILQSINQIRRGIERCILRFKSGQNSEFISFAFLHSLQRHACELKCLAPQPIHRPAHFPRHGPDTDPHPQPQRPQQLPQIENQFRQLRRRTQYCLKLISRRHRIRQPDLLLSQMRARRRLQPLPQQRPQICPRPRPHHIRDQHRIPAFLHFPHLVRCRTILYICTLSYNLKTHSIFRISSSPARADL